jgi:hypothetical protein
VAPYYWSLVCFIKIWFGAAGGRTHDLRADEWTRIVGLTGSPAVGSYYSIGI